MPTRLLWRALPQHLLVNFLYHLNYALHGRGNILWIAKFDAFRGLKHALDKRKKIQKSKKINPVELLSQLEKGLLQPYLIGYQQRKIKQKEKL